MTPELLQQVAEVAPDEWDVRVANNYGWLHWTVPTGQFDRCMPPSEYVESCTLALYDDFRSAKAIIAMLDAMEKAGYAGNLRPADHTYGKPVDGYLFEFWPYLIRNEQGPLTPSPLADVEFEGTTRAEAVAKAFVSVFRKD